MFIFVDQSLMTTKKQIYSIKIAPHNSRCKWPVIILLLLFIAANYAFDSVMEMVHWHTNSCFTDTFWQAQLILYTILPPKPCYNYVDILGHTKILIGQTQNQTWSNVRPTRPMVAKFPKWLWKFISKYNQKYLFHNHMSCFVLC